MNFEDYMKERSRLYAIQPVNKETKNLLEASNSLGAETGEFQNIVKKVNRDHRGNPQAVIEDLVSELGDILWYWLFACEVLHLNPEDIMGFNTNKLKARYHVE